MSNENYVSVFDEFEKAHKESVRATVENARSAAVVGQKITEEFCNAVDNAMVKSIEAMLYGIEAVSRALSKLDEQAERHHQERMDIHKKRIDRYEKLADLIKERFNVE